MSATPGDVPNADECQELCQTHQDSLGCNYWVFEAAQTAQQQKSTCVLYGLEFSFERKSCSTHHGPEYPFYSDVCE